MRVLTIVVILLSLLQPIIAQNRDIDEELVDLAQKLERQITENAKKKVTVLDFTDLQGGTTELGKYIAEQLTVNLVTGKRNFSVLDRANLKSIMAEHKLTASGLVDPENAKKLGAFAGVDALILGNIIHKSESISLTAKVITTDTAEIVGAARAHFKIDETIKQLEAKIAKPEVAPTVNSNAGAAPPPIRKPFGDLEIRVESLRLLPGGSDYSGSASLTLIVTNTSDTKTFGVCFPANPISRSVSWNNARGEEFEIFELAGIELGGININGGFYGALTDIHPRNAVTVTSKAQVRWTGKPGDYRPYRLQVPLVFGVEDMGRHPELKKYNWVVDIK